MQVLERAVDACSWHVAGGALVFDVYRLFENALLESLESKSDVDKTRRLIDQLYRRQLALPLLNNDATLQDYKEFLDGGDVDADTMAQYEAAMAKLKNWKPLEEKLGKVSDGDEEEISEIYREYLDSVQKDDEPATRVRYTFERAVTAAPLNHYLWQRYTNWALEERKEDAQVSRWSHSFIFNREFVAYL